MKKQITNNHKPAAILLVFLLIVLLLCAACAPSHITQDALPATEPSDPIYTELSEPPEDPQNVPDD